MKNNIFYKKGITLFETLISTIVFGIIMILMFQMSSSFFKVFTTSTSKQSMNSKFIKAYTHMHKELLISDAKYVFTYKNTSKNMKSRWILFPSPTDKDSIIKGEGSSFNWQRIYIYYLICKNSSCSECLGKSTTRDDPYKYCSDKELIRLIYDYTGSNDKYLFASSLSAIKDDISNYTLPYSSILFPNTIEYEINGNKTKTTIGKFVEKRIIATDILDMDIKVKTNNIKIMISAVRKDDIKKEVNYGATDFTDESNLKFVDKIEFTIIPRNT